MNYLLDTHVWLWAASRTEKLGEKTRKLLLDNQSHLSVSSISALEISQLLWAGKITLPINVAEWLKISAQQLRLTQIPVSTEVAVFAYALPEPFHKDPADRIIVATAIQQGLVLLTAAQKMLDYSGIQTWDCRE